MHACGFYDIRWVKSIEMYFKDIGIYANQLQSVRFH